MHTGAIPQRADRLASCSATRRARSPAPSTQGGQVRAGRGRHHLPRRDLDDGRAHAGQPPARARVVRATCASAARRSARPTCAWSRRPTATSSTMVRGGQLPRGPLLPAQHPSASSCRRCASAREDIPLLASEFLRAVRRAVRQAGRGRSRPRRSGCSRATHWPGNVRELRNVIEQAVLLARGADARSRAPAADDATAPAAREDVIRIPLGTTMRRRRRARSSCARSRRAGQQEDHRRGARHLPALALQQAGALRHRRTDDGSASHA